MPFLAAPVYGPPVPMPRDQHMSDVLFIDPTAPAAISRRSNFSIIASIPARYTLTRQIDANGRRREFSCRVVKLSPDTLTLAAPVNGALGERVIVTLLEFGKLEGTVLKTLELGFVMSVNLTDEEREKFAARIEWYEKHKNHDLPDNRTSKRIIPQNPHSVIVLSDGSVMGAFIIDMSVSGDAVSADIEPRNGEALAVGKIVGRVVRRFPGGFGVKFIGPQDPLTLEKMLGAPVQS